jgi:2,3-dihydroxybiphenyl 1,2-dioxygenase
MFHQLELAYLGIDVPDPSTLTPFLADVIGLVPGATSTAEAPTWRDDGKVHRVLVQAGERNDAAFIGIEAVDDAAFDACIGRITAAGHDVVEGTAADLEARCVERLARTTTPWGIGLEVVLGLAAAEEPFASPLVESGFLTKDQGFGHVVFGTMAFEESCAFLTEVLGFRRSDHLEMELAPGLDLVVRFFHCNGRHHSIALARTPFEVPQSLHHFMVEVNDRDDVGRAFDRAWTAELTIANGLGRHPNDGMFSFYVVSPAGFQVEVGYGGRVVTEDWDDDQRYDRISAWGHQPIPR